ncbi:RNase adaptor protein RapZ [Vulcanibacillus modesticaldus]|uniref:RNase adaptor protein RapZ n=1 Tax=Vulcanibacillus modesticaldus TaxID=337097 RepID=A0A1D2YSS2_9BACI|nr:RNase adapter RapZ [Vulcanibacillus modesticaldus]OEF97793.1 RNase adaptor protein RapZ [Vulcanibacillus modesticaldus]
MNEARPINLIIITGMSGAGKTVAIQSLEDLGYFCVDNLPPILIPKFVELFIKSGEKTNKVALVVDLRGREFFETLSDSLLFLDESNNINYQIVFLEADDKTLVRRYKETRRKHPLSKESSPIEGIIAERKLLEELKGRASQIIDTSSLKAIELKEKMVAWFSEIGNSRVSINIISFGFKYGIPIDADLVFDVRFLPNPHYVDSLRPLTGLDVPVYEYVMKWADTKEFLTRIVDLLNYLIPKYQKEGKSQLVIGIGCTGGKHRSVAITEYISKAISTDWRVNTSHRDLTKDRG